jgi:Tol biopolymer transport system component
MKWRQFEANHLLRLMPNIGLKCAPVAIALLLASVPLGCLAENGRPSSNTFATFSISPQSSLLALSFGEDGGNSDLYLLELKGNQVTPIAKPPQHGFDPTFTPDGKLIAFAARSVDDGANHLFIESVEGKSRQQLTREFTSDTSPTFSPDGLSLAFARSRTHYSGGLAAEWGAADELCVMKTDGSDVRRLDTSGLYVCGPRFSPDGKRIVFWNPSGIYIIAADGSEKPRRFSTEKGRDAAFSADGLWLVYMAGRYEPDLTVFIARVDGSERKSVITGNRINGSSVGGIYSPRYTPDGKCIAFLHTTSPSNRGGRPKWEIWEVEKEGGSPRKLVTYELLDALAKSSARVSNGR